MQEEDFLRPDLNFDGNKLTWKNKIFNLYESLKKEDGFYSGFLRFNYMSGPFIDTGIRRCGMINVNKLPAFPRMHNKFIICYDCNISIKNHRNNENYYIHGEVLTGSYNYTENSNNSLENIVCIKDKKIVSSFYKQFGQIAVISVPLDWEGEWEPKESGIYYGS